MTPGLRNTILASSALAGFINLAQFAISYNQRAQAAFAPSWADAATHPHPTATPSAKAQTATTPVPAAPATATASDLAAPIAAKLAAAGLSPTYSANYLAVQSKTGTPWQLLAAVHAAETGQSGDTARRSYAGATGPMQFMPATFAHYAQDGDGNGTKDITSFADSLLTAGRYLAAGGADKGKYTTALYNYNHSNAYVSHVMSIAHRLGL